MTPATTPLPLFSIDAWPPALAALSVPFRVIPLAGDFIRYLESDGILLPRSEVALKRHDPRFGDEPDESQPGPFAELEAAIDAALVALGGSAFIKLNYSAPVDCKWVMGSIQCRSAGDVYLLLKSSDFVTHDLALAPRPVLCLKKWLDVDPAHEFTCVVSRGEVCAVFQRDAGQFFAELRTRAKPLHALVSTFVSSRVVPAFDSQGGDYAVDVLLASEQVWLVDVGPVPREHPLLQGPSGQLHFVASPGAVDRARDRALAAHRVPFEVVTGHVRDLSMPVREDSD